MRNRGARGVRVAPDAREANGTDEHFVGHGLTSADVAIWDVVDAVTTFIEGASLVDHGRLRAFHAAFADRPSIAAYVTTRPKS